MAGELVYPSSLRRPIISDIDGDESDGILNAIKFTIMRRTDDKNMVLDKIVYLYMPTNLKNPTDVSWEQKGTGKLGAAFAQGSKFFFGDTTVGDIANKLTAVGSDIDAQDVAKGAYNMLGEGAESGTGQIVNPFVKMLFRGLNMRTFEFQFKFTPRTVNESNEIKDIIDEFRMAALPELEMGSFALTYPKEIQIEYVQRGGDVSASGTNRWLNKFKHCVITGLDVDYASAGFYVPMRDGFPSETVLTLRFTENELVTREDIGTVTGQSGDPTDPGF